MRIKIKSVIRPALGMAILSSLCLGQAAENPGTPAVTQQNSAAIPTQTSEAPPQPDTEAIASASGAVLKVTTRMVLVDAVVVGKDGKPVGGLKADDFEVIEDGNRQEVKAFGAVVLPTPGSSPVPRRQAISGFFTNTIDFHREDGAPIILLLDALNTQWADKVYGRAQLLEFISKNASRRNMAIYVLGHRLSLLQDFTDDPVLLREAVSGVQVTRLSTEYSDLAHGGVSAGDMTDAPPTAAPTNPAALRAQVMGELAALEGMITKYDRDRAIATTLEAFRSIARRAAGIPGRKQLIWLSSSFPLNFDVVANTTFAAEFEETSNLMTDAQLAVYPVDVRGLVAFDPLSAEAGMANLRAAHIAMNFVASRTGGVAFYNRNDIDNAIAQAVDEGSTFYVLGYYPKNKNWHSEFRGIQVKVHLHGLTVRCRKGYYATVPDKRTQSEDKWSRQEFLKAVAGDPGSSGMLPIFAQVFPPDKDHAQVFLDVRVDPHSVLFTRESNGYHEAELKFVTVVLDEKDKVVTTKFDTLKTNLSPATFAQVMRTSLAIRQKIDLATGIYKMRVGVRDTKSELVGTLTAHVEVPEKE